MNRALIVEERARILSTDGATINMRDSPSRDGQVVARLSFNTMVTVVGESVPADDLTWRQVRTDDGQEGYVVEAELFSRQFLLARPLLRAVESNGSGQPSVLLIDEIDRADEEFEAFLLELLSDFQVTIPELRTIQAVQPPVVIVTSNRTRDVHDALKHRCLYYWIEYPDFQKELAIVRRFGAHD